MNKTEISKWLNNLDYSKEPLIYKLDNNNIDDYYNDNDLKKNEVLKLKSIFDLHHNIKIGKIKYLDMKDKRLIDDSNYIQLFKNDDKTLYYYNNQYSNRYHVNMLFNKMIDYCIKHNLKNKRGDYYVTKNMRSRFIEFCYIHKTI